MSNHRFVIERKSHEILSDERKNDSERRVVKSYVSTASSVRSTAMNRRSLYEEKRTRRLIQIQFFSFNEHMHCK